jgi:hypothetical protein
MSEAREHGQRVGHALARMTIVITLAKIIDPAA